MSNNNDILDSIRSLKAGFISKSDIAKLVTRVSNQLESFVLPVGDEVTSDAIEESAVVDNRVTELSDQIDALSIQLLEVVEISNALNKFREKTGMRDEFKEEFNALLDRLAKINTEK